MVSYFGMQIPSFPVPSLWPLGSYHFLPGGGGRLSVMAGRQFFLVPPFAFGKKIWSPFGLIFAVCNGLLEAIGHTVVK